MRVLQVIPSFDVSFGGPVRSAFAVNEALSFDHDVFTVGIGIPAGDWKDRPAIGFGFIPILGQRHVSRLSPSVVFWAARNLARFDHVHIHLSRSPTILMIAAMTAFSGKSFTIQTHGMCNPWSGVKGAVDRLAVWPVMRRSAAVLVLNDSERMLLGKRVPIEKISVVYNALPQRVLDSERVSQKGGTTSRILFAGRLHSRKKLDFAIQVVAEMVQRRVAVSMDVAGPDEGGLQKARQLSFDLDVPVTFHGALNRSDLRDLMQSCDMLLHPAPNEPFGMAMIEAMVEGLPVVAARSSHLASQFEEFGAAVLADDNDVSKWASIACQIVADNDLRESLAKGGFDLVRSRFSIDSLRRRLAEFVRPCRLHG